MQQENFRGTAVDAVSKEKREEEYSMLHEGNNLQAEYSKNYQSWIFDSIAPFLGRRIMEVGAGTGLYAHLMKDYELYCPTDVEAGFLAILEKKFQSDPRVKVMKYDAEKDDGSTYAAYNFDTVLAFSVIEHIADDQAALIHLSNLLQRNGNLIIFTPAFNALYGTNDQAIGHYRRYTKQELIKKFARCNLKMEKIAYHNMVGMLGWFLNGRVLKRKIVTAGQLSLFDKMVPLLKFAENIVSPWWGLNIVAVGKKI